MVVVVGGGGEGGGGGAGSRVNIAPVIGIEGAAGSMLPQIYFTVFLVVCMTLKYQALCRSSTCYDVI